MFKAFDRHQDLLIPASFSEVINPGDLANVIAEVIEGLDLSPIIRRYDPLGQNAYHPKMLLALLFYAYSQGVFSSRKIAERIRYDVRFMFLSGRLHPDFRTIADFRKNHIDLLPGLFIQIVQLCRALGLIALKTVAIDGAKIKANAANDTHQLTPMVAQLEANTSSEEQPKAVTADSGFSSAAAFTELEQKPHVTAYVPTQRQVKRQRQGVGPYSKEQFELDPVTGVGRCPLGQPMRLLRHGVNKSGQGYYHFIGTACGGCPVRRECTRASYRSVVLLQAEAVLLRMEARVKSPPGRAALRLRRETVEPVIGILKEQLGFRRFHLRGLSKVRGEFARLCAAFDLRKLHQLLSGRSVAAAMAALCRILPALNVSLRRLAARWGSAAPCYMHELCPMCSFRPAVGNSKNHSRTDSKVGIQTHL
jgi:transposase